MFSFHLLLILPAKNTDNMKKYIFLEETKFKEVSILNLDISLQQKSLTTKQKTYKCNQQHPAQTYIVLSITGTPPQVQCE